MEVKSFSEIVEAVEDEMSFQLYLLKFCLWLNVEVAVQSSSVKKMDWS